MKGGIAVDVQVLGRVRAPTLMVSASGYAAISGPGAAGETPGQHVSLAPLPAPARTTVERLTSGGETRSLMQVEGNRRLVYHVEGRVDEKEVQSDIAGDGAVLLARGRIVLRSLAGGSPGLLSGPIPTRWD